jgi:hypothetical protein
MSITPMIPTMISMLDPFQSCNVQHAEAEEYDHSEDVSNVAHESPLMN